MNWSELDWRILDRLRDRFLASPAAGGGAPYWQSPEDLAHYDLTYGERIGWKWDQVLRELRLRRWLPRPSGAPSGPDFPPSPDARLSVLDWGCGSGVASRRVIQFFGPENFSALTLWDHSPLATDFAADAAQRAFPGLPIAQATPGFLASDEPLGLLVVSHVLNELNPAALGALRALVLRAEAVLWVEPGTHALGRQLAGLRDELRGAFHVVAPCTHAENCPVISPGNERHWCHFFAPPPAAIFADSEWVKFGHRAGIDLRSVPYSFLALDRRAPAALPAGCSRVLGRVEHFKPYARLLDCDASGLVELELPRRAAPTLYKHLERTRAPLVYRWTREGNKILGGVALEAG